MNGEESTCGVKAGSCTYPDCACVPNGDVGCNSPNATARGVMADVKPCVTNPKATCQRPDLCASEGCAVRAAGVTPCCPPGEPHAFLCPNGVKTCDGGEQA